ARITQRSPWERSDLPNRTRRPARFEFGVSVKRGMTVEDGAEATSADRIQRARLDKLARLEDAGVRGFPTSFTRSHKAQEISNHFEALDGQRACVAGRVGVFKILSKNLSFVFLQDDSGQIQLIFHPRDFD